MGKKLPPLRFPRFLEVYILEPKEVENIKRGVEMGDRRFDGAWWWNDLNYMVVEPHFLVH